VQACANPKLVVAMCAYISERLLAHRLQRAT